MANFYIQTDKDFYFAGQTVNGHLFINVGALIVGATGVSLKWTGYECVKWQEAKQLHRPRPPHHRPGHPPPPPPYDPIAAIPPHQLSHMDRLPDVSDCESESNRDYDHRPKYIKTAQNRYYQMSYYETRNMFTKAKVMIFNCSGFQPGQYSFPFSFKTYEGWPASFDYRTPQKKGVIIYHMVAAIQPVAPNFKLQGGRPIILRETRYVQAQQLTSQAQVTDCCCINKGFTRAVMTYSKDGFTPGQMVGMVIELDNSQCGANVQSITVSVNNVVTLRSQGHATSDSRRFFNKTLNGVLAGERLQGTAAINETFQMPNNPQIKPTCSGTLLSSQYSISININHDINCSCCSDRVGSSIPIIIFPVIPVYAMPNVFQNNWSPQVMPAHTLPVTNTWGGGNPNLNAMGGMGGGPPVY